MSNYQQDKGMKILLEKGVIRDKDNVSVTAYWCHGFKCKIRYIKNGEQKVFFFKNTK